MMEVLEKFKYKPSTFIMHGERLIMYVLYCFFFHKELNMRKFLLTV